MTKPKYRRLTYDDRRVIENMCKAKKTQSEIADAIGVSQSTMSRELSCNRVDGIHTQGKAPIRTYLRLLIKPKIYNRRAAVPYFRNFSKEEVVA